MGLQGAADFYHGDHGEPGGKTWRITLDPRPCGAALKAHGLMLQQKQSPSHMSTHRILDPGVDLPAAHKTRKLHSLADETSTACSAAEISDSFEDSEACLKQGREHVCVCVGPSVSSPFWPQNGIWFYCTRLGNGFSADAAIWGSLNSHERSSKKHGLALNFPCTEIASVYLSSL